MKSWLNILLISILLLCPALASCQTTGTAVQGKKSIVVTYSVLGAIVKDLVGDKANVVISIPNGQDPHDWEPSAKDIEAIFKADLVVQNGLGLENGLEKTLSQAQSKGIKFFSASDHIVIRHVGQGEGIPSGDPDQAIGAPDPHLWMDPLSIKSVAAALAIELAQDFDMDVSSKAQDLENKLDTLNQQTADILSVIPLDDRKLVTGHESMGYFAQRYNLKLIGVIIPSLTTQAEVSARDLAELKKTIQANQVKAIFTELGTNPNVAKTIGDETGVKVTEITTHSLPADGSYTTFIKNLASTIAEGLK